MKNIHIELTESGNKKLKELTADIENKVIENIKNSKYAPGDEIIEITGADIDNVSNRIKFIQPNQSNFRQLLLFIYSFIGVLLIFIGVFYDDFKLIIEGNPIRLVLTVSGLSFLLVSIFYSIYFKNKLNIEKEIYLKSVERENLKDLYTIINEEKNNNIAHTQYNDLKGTSALDFHGGILELHEIFSKYNIDTNKYRPYGLSFFKHFPDFFNLQLLAVIKYNGQTKKKNVISISVNISEKEFNNLYKRFHSILVLEDNNFEIVKEVTLEEL